MEGKEKGGKRSEGVRGEGIGRLDGYPISLVAGAGVPSLWLLWLIYCCSGSGVYPVVSLLSFRNIL